MCAGHVTADGWLMPAHTRAIHAQVVVRCRPPNEREQQDRRAQIVDMDVREGQVMVRRRTCARACSWSAALQGVCRRQVGA